MAQRVYKPIEKIQNPISSEKIRFWELDFLRGLCVILMVVDHFFFSAMVVLKENVWTWADKEFWKGLQSFSETYWVNNARNVMHYVVVCLFFLICGISCTLSNNNLLRGLKAIIVAALITVVTVLADKILKMEIAIWFGVIHMLAVSMLIFSLLDFVGILLKMLLLKIDNGKKLRGNIRVKPHANDIDNVNNQTGSDQTDINKAGKIDLSFMQNEKGKDTLQKVAKWTRWLFPGFVGIVGIILFFCIPLGHFRMEAGDINVYSADGTVNEVTFYFVHLFSNVQAKGSNAFNNFVSIFVHLNGHVFKSSDYFPILPYGLIVLIGSLLGRLIYHTKAKTYLTKLNGNWHSPVSFVGRHALLFYLLHQVVIVAFFFLVGSIYMVLG